MIKSSIEYVVILDVILLWLLQNNLVNNNNKTALISFFLLLQFLNSPGGTNTSAAVTSTPVCSRTETPRSTELLCTPKHEASALNSINVLRTPTIVTQSKESEPRTPTPFKNALANLEKRSGIVRTEVG